MNEEKWEESVERDELLEQERALELQRAAEAERRAVKPQPVAAQPVRRQEVARTQRRGYRSLFWPVVLIGAGVLWLLSNLGIIGAENWSVLLRLWPILLIAAGLDLLIGRFSAVLGSLIGLLTVAVVVALVIIGPSLGWAGSTNFFGLPITTGPVEVKSASFSEPVSGAGAADITLDLAQVRATVSGLGAGAGNLIEADVDYFGEFRFDVSGGARRRVSLRQEFAPVGVVGPWNQPELANMAWDIRLSPDVPLDLTVDFGSAAAEIDLSELVLTSLEMDGGSGRARVALPAVEEMYRFSYNMDSGASAVTLPAAGQVDMEVDGGSGRFEMQVEQGATLRLDLDGGSGPSAITLADGVSAEFFVVGGSGPIAIDVPEGAAVQVEVQESGSGPLILSRDLEQISDGDDDDEDTGIWQTPGFDDADEQITIIVTDAGSGPINID